MAIKFTIGKKIGAGFAVLIILTTLAFILTVVTLKDSKSKTDTVVGQLAPSVAELKELNLLIERSVTDVTQWMFNSSSSDIDFREDLENIIATEYLDQRKELDSLSQDWSVEEKKSLKTIFLRIESIFRLYKSDIMSQLANSEDYQDALKTSIARISYEDSQTDLERLYKELNSLIQIKQNAAEQVKEKMFRSFNFLQRFVQLLGVTLVVGGIFIALFTARSITKPVSKLRKMLLSMGLGILPKERFRPRNDEIGDMGNALNELIQSMHQTTKFAEETGAGNFEAIHKPLSKDDNLGHSLIKMRDNLAENERGLEQKVKERTEEVVRQKEEIENKNGQLEILYKQVTDSILYAKRIQEAILPPESIIKELVPNSFVLFKPKDIVSGDFYWFDKKEELVYFSTVDCTGHGVPGAFMSLVGHNILKDIVNNTKLKKPADMLNKMRELVVKTLHADSDGTKAKDGMDMTLCAINYKTLELQYAAAYNPLYIVRNGELMEHPANKFPIGAFVGEYKDFDNRVIQLEKGDTIYLFSDGYADQFGGPKGKKFMVGNFRKLLLQVSNYAITDQKQVLNKALTDWQGTHEQVDDVLLIGVKI
ncbi:MAG: SpoIIE family protein phosphatase [Bacteroidota bacterium]|nr:SpoIIE family protein phosphatase [Bacteroidota bacterium]